MFSTLSSFSQNGTTKTILNEDSVTISKAIAQNIAKDLVLLKARTEENLLIKADNRNLQNQVILLDSFGVIQRAKINLLSGIVTIKDRIITVKDSQIARTEKKLKWANTKLTIAGGMIVIGTAVILLTAL